MLTSLAARSSWLAALGLVVALGMFPGSSAGTAPASTWSDALEVPGLAALNAGGAVGVVGVSCARVGECAAGGWYKDGGAHYQAFVVSETKGVWGAAEEVPGLAALNVGAHAVLSGISCGAVGDCVAGGFYTDGSGFKQAFVVTENTGVWGAAVEVPGTSALNTGGYAAVQVVSCAGAGACAAGGLYSDGSAFQAFVVSEKKGVWRAAVEVPGTAALNVGGDAQVRAVSCGAVGKCAAGGFYRDSVASNTTQAFVVGEKKGIWSKAVEVPGTAALNAGGNAIVNALSCAGAGNCAGGGSYVDGAGHTQAFVVSEKNGVWRRAVEVKGTATLNAGGNAPVASVSCGAPGQCAVSGFYTDASAHRQAFVASEKKGVWRAAVKVPGTAALNAGGTASLFAVSCGGVGECAGGGFYKDGGGHFQAFVVNEENGVWHKAVEVPGTAALNVGGSAAVNGVSCAGIGDCAAAGSYTDGSGHYQGFVVDAIARCVVPKVVGKTLRAAKHELVAYHCAAGKITSVYADKRKGRVVAQHPKPGTRVKRGSKVALIVSKGKR